MKGKRKWVLVLGIFAVLLAGVYVGGVLWFQNHFFFNTSVNGLNASGKTVDESRAWLKRIIITWAILNGLGFIMAYITPFFAGGQWNG